jgi:hypothetical protein
MNNQRMSVIAWVLVIALLVPSSILVKAQEVTSPETPAPTPSTAPVDITPDTIPVQDTPPIQNNQPEDTTNTKPSTPTTDVGIQSVSDIYRDNSRDVVNTFHVEPESLTGSMQYGFSLTVPPGRNNLTPDVKLSYSSQPSENINLYGYGWSDNIPYIQKMNKDGSNNLYLENNFYSSIDGELQANDTSSTTESYGPRVENGNFNSYQYVGNYKWLVTDKLGTTYKFGYASTSAQYSTATSSYIYKWMLQEVRDPNDNYIKYEYYQDGGQMYPSKITYTGSGVTDGIFEISFLREARSDTMKSSKAGFPVTSNYRINEIQVKVNGVWVHKYQLGYSNGANGMRSLLTTITESGQDESSNITILPATTFTYQTDLGNKSWTQDNSWNEPEAIVSGARSDLGTRLVDVNGDGLIDVLVSRDTNTGTFSKAYLHTINGWVESATWTPPVTFVDNTSHYKGVELADVNGDGLLDIINTGTATYINNGNGWTETASWQAPIGFVNVNSPSKDAGVRIVDVNGDGLPDILRALQNTLLDAYINNGHGWTQNSTWFVPKPIIDLDAQDAGARFADVNGDGLIDIIYARDSAQYGKKDVYINNGAGWTLDSTWSSSFPLYFSDTADLGLRLADVNGDGLVDVLRGLSTASVSYEAAYLNNGLGWFLDTDGVNWAPPWTFVDSDRSDQGVRIYDANGDGMDDLTWNIQGGTNNTRLNNSKKVDLLSSVSFNTGATTNVSYKTSALYATSTPLNPQLPQNYDTVEKIVTADGLGNYATSTYTYEGGDYYFASSTDRHPAGFAIITKTDPASTTMKTFYQQGNSTNASIGESQDGFSKIGKPYRVEIADKNGSLYSKSINTWATSSLSNGREYVKVTQKVDADYDGLPTYKAKAEGYTYDNATGNITQKVEYGQVTTTDAGVVTDTGSDKFTTTIAYASSTGPLIIKGLPKQETTVDQSSLTVKDTKYYYDTLAFGNVDKGNETKQERLKPLLRRMLILRSHIIHMA